MNLQYLSGPTVLELVVVNAGERRTLGRGAAAAIRINDEELGELHCELVHDDKGARIIAMGERFIVRVNGQRVRDERVYDNDVILVGRTSFLVQAAGTRETPAETPAPVASGDLDALLDSLEATPRDCARWILRSERPELYVVVDAAKDPEVLEVLNGGGEQFCAFDETREPDDLGDTAPVLVHISRDAPLLESVVEEFWGNGWAVFFTSDAGFNEVYGHLLERTVYDEEGVITSKHFWDPKVLQELFANSSHDELKTLNGPVRAWFVESEDGLTLRRYQLGDTAMRREDYRLEMPPRG